MLAVCEQSLDDVATGILIDAFVVRTLFVRLSSEEIHGRRATWPLKKSDLEATRPIR